MRPSLQLVFELRWEYYLLDNEWYYKTAKTHHLSQLRISRIIKIKIKLIIHYYMEFILSQFTGCGGAERVRAPLPFARSPTRTLSPFARTRGHTLTRHRFPFVPPLWCTHPSVCAPPCSHTLPLARTQGHTVALSHPRCGAPTHPFARSSPAWVAPRPARMPFACT